MYSAGESDGNAQVCVVTNTGHADSVDVVVMSVEKPTAANPASGKFKLTTTIICNFLLLLTPKATKSSYHKYTAIHSECVECIGKQRLM